jgi:hypothetical protein
MNLNDLNKKGKAAFIVVVAFFAAGVFQVTTSVGEFIKARQQPTVPSFVSTQVVVPSASPSAVLTSTPSATVVPTVYKYVPVAKPSVVISK